MSPDYARLNLAIKNHFKYEEDISLEEISRMQKKEVIHYFSQGEDAKVDSKEIVNIAELERNLEKSGRHEIRSGESPRERIFAYNQSVYLQKAGYEVVEKENNGRIILVVSRKSLEAAA